MLPVLRAQREGSERCAELAEAHLLAPAHSTIPASTLHVVDCWLKLTPQQQVDTYEMHGLGSTDHSVNLITENSNKKPEPKVF
jgi:hypothetical protein